MPWTDLDFTVIVATRNREALLREALESLLAQSAPSRYEIIVVNNGSTDGTAEMVKQYQTANPGRVSLVEEPIAGLSRARNAGLRAAHAPLLAFFDDDALAAPGWLTALGSCFEGPRVAAAGGPIELAWRSQRPAWWEDDLDLELGKLDYGKETIDLAYPHFPYGMNIAFRRAALVEVGLFRESLGRRGKGLMAAEELELCLRLWKAGFAVRYHPGAVVRHLVAPERLRKAYLRRQSYWHGVSRRRAETLAHSRYSVSRREMPKRLIKRAFSFLSDRRLRNQLDFLSELGYDGEALQRTFFPLKVSTPPSLEDRS